MLVLLNGTDSADSDGKELDGEVGFVPGLELENKVRNLLALKGDLVVAPDGAIIIQVKAQAAVQTEKALKTVKPSVIPHLSFRKVKTRTLFQKRASSSLPDFK